MEEKRFFERVLFGAEVLLETGGARYRETLLDISLKGALIRVERPVSISLNETCRLIVPLSEDATMIFRGRAVHSEDDRIGLEFLEADTDSIAHLRRLLELNTGDSERIERELHFLARGV